MDNQQGCALGIENRKYISDVKKQMWTIYSSLVVMLCTVLAVAWNSTAAVKDSVAVDMDKLQRSVATGSTGYTADLKTLERDYNELRVKLARDISSIQTSIAAIEKSLAEK